MYEMVNMAPPWSGMKPEELSRTVVTGGRPLIAPEHVASVPNGWIELMEQCWDQNAENRPNFDAIHNTLKEIRNNHEFSTHRFDNAFDATSVFRTNNQTTRRMDTKVMPDHEMEMYYSLPQGPNTIDACCSNVYLVGNTRLLVLCGIE